jgi:hypothetical protein
MKTRIQVLSQGGKLIGVYIPPTVPAIDPNAPTAHIRAGRGQKIFDIEVELTQPLKTLKTARQIDAFHATLRKQLKLRK